MFVGWENFDIPICTNRLALRKLEGDIGDGEGPEDENTNVEDPSSPEGVWTCNSQSEARNTSLCSGTCDRTKRLSNYGPSHHFCELARRCDVVDMFRAASFHVKRAEDVGEDEKYLISFLAGVPHGEEG